MAAFVRVNLVVVRYRNCAQKLWAELYIRVGERFEVIACLLLLLLLRVLGLLCRYTVHFMNSGLAILNRRIVTAHFRRVRKFAKSDY
jgi:hypothetical protein